MIRKIFMLAVITFIFLFSAWNFYSEALSYHPLSDISFKKFKPKEADIILATKYVPGWAADIYGKNPFSPLRKYVKPQVIPVTPEKPKKKPTVELKGIVLDTFGDYVSYIQIDKAKPLPMRMGDKSGDFELVDISGRNVVLQWYDETINLTMDKIKTIEQPGKTK